VRILDPIVRHCPSGLFVEVGVADGKEEVFLGSFHLAW
jgi:hypothetical protein